MPFSMRRTKEESWALREAVRQDLVNLLRPQEIARKHGVSRATLYRMLAEMRKEEVQWLEDQVKDEFLHEYRLTMDRLEEYERQLWVVAAEATRDRDKIEALRLAKEAELEKVELLAYGPTVLAVKRSRQPKVQAGSGLQAP